MKTRSIFQELFIDAAPDKVWQAFTEAEHIQNWFAAAVDSDPREGGVIELKWDLGDDTIGQRCEITEWQPQQRLVMSWRNAPDGEYLLPVEVVLSGQDGGTLLRLTHSGFLSDASWDDEFDSHARGWTYELKSLRYYLERKFGHRRALSLLRLPLSDDWRTQWSALVGPKGLIRVDEHLTDGTACAVRLPTGEDSAAEILNALTDRDFAVVLAALEGGVMRLTFETFAGGPEVWFWVSSWQLNDDQLHAVVQPWYEKIGSVIQAR